MGCFISQLAAKFAFFPPSPATYQVIKRDDGKLIAVPPTTSSMPPISYCEDDDSLDVLLLDTKRGNRIVAFYLKDPYAKLTLLYSHGNAADLGQLYDLFLQLKANLRVNLIGYDYSGYGASTGTNINKIRKVKCPVLVIHGTEDDVVNWLHGEGLWKMARDPYEPLWIKGGGHCNLELYPDYILHLCRFIQEMENMTTEIRLKKIWQTLHLPNRSNPVSSSSTNWCCRIKLGWKCSAPSCLKCLSRPKCPECRPKCPDCLRCCIPRRPDCLRCCIPKCPDCLRPGFTKYLCSVKCSCWCINCPCW